MTDECVQPAMSSAAEPHNNVSARSANISAVDLSEHLGDYLGEYLGILSRRIISADHLERTCAALHEGDDILVELRHAKLGEVGHPPVTRGREAALRHVDRRRGDLAAISAVSRRARDLGEVLRAVRVLDLRRVALGHVVAEDLGGGGAVAVAAR